MRIRAMFVLLLAFLFSSITVFPQTNLVTEKVLLFSKKDSQKERILFEGEKVNYKLKSQSKKTKGQITKITDSSVFINQDEILFDQFEFITDKYELIEIAQKVLFISGAASIVMGGSGVIYMKVNDLIQEEFDGFFFAAMLAIGIMDLSYGVALIPITFKRFDLVHKWGIETSIVPADKMKFRKLIKNVDW